MRFDQVRCNKIGNLLAVAIGYCSQLLEQVPYWALSKLIFQYQAPEMWNPDGIKMINKP